MSAAFASAAALRAAFILVHAMAAAAPAPEQASFSSASVGGGEGAPGVGGGNPEVGLLGFWEFSPALPYGLDDLSLPCASPPDTMAWAAVVPLLEVVSESTDTGGAMVRARLLFWHGNSPFLPKILCLTT